MSEPFETTNYLGYQINLHYEQDAQCPREWDNLGRMICFHRRYNLGDAHDHNISMSGIEHAVLATFYANEINQDDEEECDAHYDAVRNSVFEGLDGPLDAVPCNNIDMDSQTISFRLYLYDHSGITMNINGFFCPWDSGVVGYIYARFEDIARHFGWPADKPLPSHLLARAEDVLRDEVKAYDSFISHQCHGWEIRDQNDTHIDSLWGFGYDGSSKDALQDARSSIEWHIINADMPPGTKVKLIVQYKMSLLARAQFIARLNEADARRHVRRAA